MPSARNSHFALVLPWHQDRGECAQTCRLHHGGTRRSARRSRTALLQTQNGLHGASWSEVPSLVGWVHACRPAHILACPLHNPALLALHPRSPLPCLLWSLRWMLAMEHQERLVSSLASR